MPRFKHVRLEYQGQQAGVAVCKTCRWRSQDKRIADSARIHAKETGHTVIVEKSTQYTVIPTNRG